VRFRYHLYVEEIFANDEVYSCEARLQQGASDARAMGWGESSSRLVLRLGAAMLSPNVPTAQHEEGRF
jgi:hypothetical protein